MYKIEADIKKRTINTFVKLLDELPYLSIENIRMLANGVCDLIDKEVDKTEKELEKELDDIF